MELNDLMQIPFGLIILIGCLLIGIYIVSDYLVPNVICKIIPRTGIKSQMGEYNSNILGEICSGIG